VANLATLGAFPFVVTSLRIGARPRAIGMSANALAQYPVETTDYIPGYRPIDIGGKLTGVETTGESAADHLQRLWDNLETEVAKDRNVLTLDFGASTNRVYTVYKNELVEIVVLKESKVLHRVTFSLTLKCLP
jgi:hypothetical protein